MNKWEQEKYFELKMLLKQGKIHNLKPQHSVEIKIAGKKIFKYTIDFYCERAGIRFWIETKGHFRSRDIVRFKAFLATIEGPGDYVFLQDKKNMQYYQVKLTEQGRVHRLIGRKWKAWSYK